jgi:hypothetical protein
VFVPGVILLVIGAVCLAVYWMGVPEPALRIAGVILVIVGAVLVLLDVLDSSDAEAAGFVVPGFVGMTAVPPSHPRRAPQAAPTPPRRGAEKSWLPTRKWWAQLTGGVASVVASWLISGSFDDVERGMAATLLLALAASYWTPNADTRAGVPPKK